VARRDELLAHRLPEEPAPAGYQNLHGRTVRPCPTIVARCIAIYAGLSRQRLFSLKSVESWRCGGIDWV
jgi:hypothetical protein